MVVGDGEVNEIGEDVLVTWLTFAIFEMRLVGENAGWYKKLRC